MLPILMLAACDQVKFRPPPHEDTAPARDTGEAADGDGDGYTVAGGDCDDSNPAVNPDAAEDCATSYDDDCDGVFDEEGATGCTVYHRDEDGDEYGSADGACLCEATETWVTTDSSDCDDGDSSVNPDGVDIVDDAVDQDCDGDVGCGRGWRVASLACADTLYTGRALDSNSGRPIDGAGDVDRDGFDDLMIGEYGFGSGAAGLVLGEPTPASKDVSAADAIYTGEREGDCAGGAVAGAGDVDGDGFSDILIGAPCYDLDFMDPRSEGAAYLVLGDPSPGSIDLTEADAVYAGEYESDSTGNAVAGAGDVNGDGFDDLLVGIYNFSEVERWRGAVYLILGNATPASHTTAESDAVFTCDYVYGFAGSNLANAGAGDVNGDGLDDFVYGAADHDGGEYAGAVYLVLGQEDASTGTTDEWSRPKFTGEAVMDLARTAAGAGDVDGDGYQDILAGAYGNDDGGEDAGAAYLVLGLANPRSSPLSDAQARLTGETPGDWAGYALAGAGDVDGDGFDDMVIGRAYGVDDDDAGSAYLVFGDPDPASRSLAEADAKFLGEREGDGAGKSLAGAGDIDGDGMADFLIGTNVIGDAEEGANAAYLILGAGR